MLDDSVKQSRLDLAQRVFEGCCVHRFVQLRVPIVARRIEFAKVDVHGETEVRVLNNPDVWLLRMLVRLAEGLMFHLWARVSRAWDRLSRTRMSVDSAIFDSLLAQLIQKRWKLRLMEFELRSRLMVGKAYMVGYHVWTLNFA